MTFLRNAWYAAGWTHQLTEIPLARTILDEPVVLFRTEDGQAHALRDTCPHRFGPFSRGRVLPGGIACPYHGLEFDSGGKCVRNPHGKGTLPAALAVRSYPLAERYGMLWLWMGEASTADPTKLPDLPRLEDPDFSWVHGELDVQANYELVIDNLLDLTHVEFMHPMLSSPGNSYRTEFRADQSGDVVSAYYDVKEEPITGLFQSLWQTPQATADLHAYMRWHAPSNLYLDTGMITDEPDGDRSFRRSIS